MTGRGASSVGLVDPDSGRVVLCDDIVTRSPARRFSFGPFRQGSLPIAGDWDGDGLAGVGLYSPSIATFRLRNGSDGFIGHRSVVFGPTGGRPVAGDWSGSGRDGIGLYDPTSGIFFLKDEASDGPADHVVAFGDPGEDLWPIAGRFAPDAPRGDSVGLYDPRRGVFHLKTTLESGPADLSFGFGPGGGVCLPVAGDFTGQGHYTVGLVDPVTRVVYLRFENSHGPAHAQFAVLDDSLFGGDWHPVAGRFAGVHGQARPASKYLDADGHLRSRLWIDRPDALSEVPERVKARRLPAELEERISELIRDGYTILRHPGVTLLAERIASDIDRIWRERPDDLLLVQKGRAKGVPFSQVRRRDRATSFRIPDLHSHSEAARELYLSELLFDFVELVFGEPAVAIQSLYFDRGSEQGLHRDPMFVRADPPSHLLAAWIALEDITEESGPLVYVPGSHRLPYAQSPSGEIEVLLDEHAQGYFDLVFHELASMADEYGLCPRSLVCRQGDVLIWHGSLFHGGAPVLSPEATRKSFVVHYATRAHYPERVSSYEEREGWFLRRRHRHRLARTRRLIGDGRARGVDNPMRDVRA